MVEEPTIALRLLMYVPEAVVDARFLEPLAPIEFGDRVDSSATREAIGQTLNWMSQVRPLVEDGSLLFTGKGRGLHPSIAFRYRQRLGETLVSDWASTEIGELSDEDLYVHVMGLAGELGGNLRLAEERAANLVALARHERVAYESVMGMRQIDDRRYSHVQLLAHLDVPDFSGDPRDLVSLRRNADAFAVWRAGLGSALSTVGSLPETEAGLREARGILSSELHEALREVSKESRRSPAIAALRAGARGLAFAGVGAVAGAVAASTMGNPIAGAAVGFASGATAKAVEAASSYPALKRARDSSQVVRTMMLSFIPKGRG